MKRLRRNQYHRLVFMLLAAAILSAASSSCGKRQLTLQMPETDLQHYSSREAFDPASYLESLRIVGGAVVMNKTEREVIAAFVYDAYYYPVATNIDYRVSGACDLVKLVNANFMATNQVLAEHNGKVRVADIVASVKPYLRNPPQLAPSSTER